MEERHARPRGGTAPRPRRAPPPRGRCRAARRPATAAPGRRPARPPPRAASRRVPSGSVSTRWRNAASIRPDSGAAGSAKPPASSAEVRPRGSSSSASGLPRVSARIRSRTRSSSGPATTESQQRARVGLVQALDDELGQARRARPPAPRVAKISATDSAYRRRATNASVSRDARSSHCASSTRQTSGRSAATSDSSAEHGQPEQEPVRRLAGAQPERGARARRAAARAGARGGRASARTAGAARRTGAPSRNRTPAARATRSAGRGREDMVEQRRLADAGLAAQHEHGAASPAQRFEDLVESRDLAAAPAQHRPTIRRGALRKRAPAGADEPARRAAAAAATRPSSCSARRGRRAPPRTTGAGWASGRNRTPGAVNRAAAEAGSTATPAPQATASSTGPPRARRPRRAWARSPPRGRPPSTPS